MNFTSFNPLIVTNNAAPIIELFEELGFKRRHKLETELRESVDLTSVRMKNEGGFYVDISEVKTVERDLTLIRMNVPDFDEAYEFLTSKGFKNAAGDKVTDTGSSKAALMVSPSGFAISLAEHIRK